MHAAAHPRDLAVRNTQHRIVCAGIHLNAPRSGRRVLLHLLGEAEGVEQQPPRLPRLNEFQLLRKAAGIAGRGKRLLAQDGRHLVLPVPVPRRAREAQNHHIRTEPANHPHHIGKDAFAPPFGERLFGRFGKPEVDGAREELFRAIDPPGRQQFLRADQPQQIALLGTNQVLPAFAAGQRQVPRAHVAAARVVGQNRGILIVGVRGDHQHAAQHRQLLQRLLDRRRAGKRGLPEKRREQAQAK